MSTCQGAPAPHSCSHGAACDWVPPKGGVKGMHVPITEHQHPGMNRADRRAMARGKRGKR